MARRRDYSEPTDLKRTRINGRPQSDPATQAGLRNIHRDTKGRVISAITPEGKRITSDGYNSPPDPSKTQAATGNLLAARQGLFKRMQQAGPNGLTPDMRAEAAQLGVTDSGFNQAMNKVGLGSVPDPAGQTAVAATPQKRAYSQPALTAVQPGMGAFQPGQGQVANNTPGSPVPKSLSPTGQSINRLTGKPFGYTPGDPTAPQTTPAPSPLMAAALAARDISRSIGDRGKAPAVAAAATSPENPYMPSKSPVPDSPDTSTAKSSTASYSVPTVPKPATTPKPASTPPTPTSGLSPTSSVRTPSSPSARFTPPSRSYGDLVGKEGYTPLQAQKIAGKKPAAKQTPTIGSSTIPKIPTSTIADRDSLLNRGIRFLNR